MLFQNELLLIASLLFHYGAVLAAWRFFGKSGLYGMTVFSTIAANIEVTILVNAFGMEQTLGNVLFAASFLITDILSENEGKKAADRAVNLGIFISLLFVLTTQSWLLFIPAQGDTVMGGMRQVFSNTPRTILCSMLVYAISQRFDVWLYHKWWNFTEKKYGDGTRFLWLRNNGSTLVSQMVNTVLFTLGAFWGIYPTAILLSIMGSSYLIFIVTSLCDTPAVYIARWMKKKYQL